MSDDVLVKVDNVSKRFCRSLKRSLWYGLQDLGSEIGGRRHGGGSGLPQSSADVQLRADEFWAVKDVSFELRRGECLGLIGRNGAGKTTLLRMLNGLIKPDTGKITMKGSIGALIALGAGFNPVLSGRENIYTNASVLGLSKADVGEILQEIIDFAEIEDFIDAPVQSYSSGMQVRLGFAIASSINPKILILDEVLAVGDAQFRAKCYERIGKILPRAAVLIVSHDEAQIVRLTNKCLLLERGEPKTSGATGLVIEEYRRRTQVITRQNTKRSKSQNWILSDKVTHANGLVVNPIVEWGDDLAIRVDISASSSMSISKAYVQFMQNSASHLHCEYDSGEDGGEGLTVSPGANQLKIIVPNLSLVSGIYVISISIHSNNGKFTIAHCVDMGELIVKGPPGVGPKVLSMSSWSL